MGRPPKTNLPEELKSLLTTIGSNLKIYREKAGLSQAELSHKSKISLTTVNEIESRSFRDIRISTLVSFSQVLKIPISALFSHSDLVFVPQSDQAQLLKASEAILQITKKIKSRTKPKA